MTAYAVEENDFKGRRVDQIESGLAVMEERAQPLQKESIFKKIFTLNSTPKYSLASSTVRLIDLGFNQWAVNAKSMARDQHGMPFNIDDIYVKGSIYTEDSSGKITYKTGEYAREFNSSDVMVEKASGIDRNVVFAQGNHVYKHEGYVAIEHSTKSVR
ncbi:MAG: hypothetical protein ACLKAK_09600 [Alkaliphilus sp.]